jgi:hypothetical protein
MKDELFEARWKRTVEKVSEPYGEPLDIPGILFLVGVQELGMLRKRKFTKDQKLDVLHIAICTLLLPYGYYEYVGRDEEGWPHFRETEHLPALPPLQQSQLMRQGIVHYFEKWVEEE